MSLKRRVRFEIAGDVFEDTAFTVVSLRLKEMPPAIVLGRKFQGTVTHALMNAHGSTQVEITVFHDEEGVRPWVQWKRGKLLYGIHAWPHPKWPNVQELVQICGGNVEVL